ncbi:hypothetical protein H5410_003847, partial [Solanum commersonii]
MALRVSVIVSNITLLFLLFLLIYYSNLVRRMMRLRKTRENFDGYLNETHLDRIFAKSLQEKTEYKAPLRYSNNGGTEMLESLNRSQFRREFILDVRLNYTPVHLINWILVLNTFIFVVLLACFLFIYI